MCVCVCMLGGGYLFGGADLDLLESPALVLHTASLYASLLSPFGKNRS